MLARGSYSLRMHGLLCAAVIVGTLALGPLAHAATTAPTGTLTQQKPLGLGGVSPFAERQADG